MVADWDSRFLEMARLVSSWSKDPSTQVGAVITRGKFVVSLGFNGHPKGVADTPDRLENREAKYRTIIHAEMNAILTAKQDLEGCTIYVWPFMPCSQCGAAVSAGRHQTGGRAQVRQRPLGGELRLYNGDLP